MVVLAAPTWRGGSSLSSETHPIDTSKSLGDVVATTLYACDQRECTLTGLRNYSAGCNLL
jgi:hypothetical protein